MQPKSPILIIEDFLSPLECEDIISRALTRVKLDNSDFEKQKITLHDPITQNRLAERIESLSYHMEEYFGYEHREVYNIEINILPEGHKKMQPVCENSVNLNGWTRGNNKDFVCMVFLVDKHEDGMIDLDFEVSGGLLQMIKHNFSISPKRGTLVVFPGDSNFLYNFSDIEIGDLIFLKFWVSATVPYVYNRENFPGNYTNWF